LVRIASYFLYWKVAQTKTMGKTFLYGLAIMI
jgi:hypothetical protein